MNDTASPGAGSGRTWPASLWPSINKLTAPLVDRLVDQSAELRLAIGYLEQRATVVDAGIAAPGGLEAGRLIAEICLGGLGTVSLRAAPDPAGTWPWFVDVYTSNPVLACLGSQYAGWSLAHGEGDEAIQALGSGPARAMGSGEDLFGELGYRDRAERTCIVLELDRVPPAALAAQVAERCGVREEHLTIILTPTSSIAGGVQVVARVLETALHKAHALGFPLDCIVDGAGSAPLSPPAPDFLTAMGRTNDAILFGGRVQLLVDAGDEEARSLAQRLPSSASADFGRPFAEILKASGFDFYAIDPLLFSPAEVTVSSLRSGQSFHAGAVHTGLLRESFTSSYG